MEMNQDAFFPHIKITQAPCKNRYLIKTQQVDPDTWKTFDKIIV